jgi:hypothetical protein
VNLLWNYPLFVFNKFQISTNYENVILNFVVLSIALARQGTSASRIKEKGLKKYIFLRKLRKCLFPEPLKTGISETRLIPLARDVVSFQRFHCIILESSRECAKGRYLPCYPMGKLVCPVEVSLCEMIVNRYCSGQTTYNGIVVPGRGVHF